MKTLIPLMLFFIPLIISPSNGVHQPAELKRFEFDNYEPGKYRYSFETVKNGKTDILQTALGVNNRVQGVYYYKLQPAGFVRVIYFADADGYRPKVKWSVVGDGNATEYEVPRYVKSPGRAPEIPIPRILATPRPIQTHVIQSLVGNG